MMSCHHHAAWPIGANVWSTYITVSAIASRYTHCKRADQTGDNDGVEPPPPSLGVFGRKNSDFLHGGQGQLREALPAFGMLDTGALEILLECLHGSAEFGGFPELG